VTVDERKEISANLTGLKKKFDETRDTCNKKEKEINWMRVYNVFFHNIIFIRQKLTS